MGGRSTCLARRKRRFSRDTSWLSLSPTEGSCCGKGVVVIAPCGQQASRATATSYNLGLSGFTGYFLRASGVFQPRFALATMNLVRIVLTMSISASTHNTHLTVSGALDQRWEVNGDLMTTGWRIMACKARTRTQ